MYKKIILLAGSSLVISFLISGCGRWNVDRHETEVATRIDTQLSIQMTRDAFLAAFPEAQLIDEDDGGARYLVHEQSDCFMCSSRKAFRRSTDIFARVVVFEGDHLTAIEPVRESGT